MVDVQKALGFYHFIVFLMIFSESKASGTVYFNDKGPNPLEYPAE